ncbi:hypothetical protein BGZ99_009323 [Dissophora globulifera]|uniref:Uncharacterized protein n=1 Tax=Dissophora globulifera TaxID=979702 RepID=A0A9P6R743_9FUNG|nr:hypothetical protein BGZ99_009323 [Dissophora globulifera]
MTVPTERSCTKSKPDPRRRAAAPQAHTRSTLILLASIALSCLLTPSTILVSAAPATSPPLSPIPVGGFAICQTASSLHVQGGVAYSSSSTFLVTTNQHFRLDLSQSFDSSATSSSPPVWANLTSDFSPFQRFHAGACTPDAADFLTVGNADADNTGSSSSGFMMAYSVAKGTWSAVNQAVSAATNANTGGGKKQDSGVSAAGRTMVGFAIGKGTNTASQGVVVGGGWIPPKITALSTLASSLSNLVTEADLIGFGNDGSLGSLTWTVAPTTGNGGSNVNTNLGPLAGAKVVVLPSASGKALVLGGVANNGGLSFGNLPIVDMVTGAVVLQKTQTSSLFAALPSPRYGHCVALSTDGNTIYMFGGSLAANDRITNDLFALDLRTWTWFQPTIKISGVLPPPVRDHQCVMIGDQFLSLLGFNANQAPASANPLDPKSAQMPSAPPIYVLSTSQGVWSTQFSSLPGTPSPPKPPAVPTNGSKGKVSAVGIAFGVIFGLAFLGVIGYLIFAHKRRQRRKAETLVLVEMQQRQQEEARLEKERQNQLQNGSLPSVPVPPPPPAAHTYNDNYQEDGGYNYNADYNPTHAGGYYPPGQAGAPNTSAAFYQPSDPFQNSNYLQHQQQQPQPPQQYYPNPSSAGVDRNPFEQGSSSYVPEEMGQPSPYMPGGQNNASHNYVRPPPPNNNMRPGGFSNGVGDKTSFIEPGSTFR